MSTKRKEEGGKPKQPARKKAAGAKTAAKKTAAKKAAPAKAETDKGGPAKKKSAAAALEARKAPAARSRSAAKKASAAGKEPAARSRKAAKRPAAEPEKLPAGEVSLADGAVGDASRLPAPEPEVESSAALMEAYRADTTSDAEHGMPQMEPEPAHEERARRRAVARAAGPVTGQESEGEFTEARKAAAEQAEDNEGLRRPEPKPERLQKILSRAGVASRRHAEEMIVAGRVMVNGQVVTQLGAKADPARDHIRVDGRLIEGVERRRTFLLNKPKGYVTTVSDPEGRPTVMEFFSNFRERLYPVGRLDFQSEGLLLMSNDGELANLLTRAASGVEKTYLVKVSGRPGENELEQLRSGVMIEREQAGSGRVRTAPASVRQIRQGENPWFEVVLTEGRNRELRKMFHAVGHFVEKIRRVGYGPLVLDVEPGKFRELSAEEVNALRLTAEGRLKPRRPNSNTMLPKEAGRSAERDRGFGGRQGRDREDWNAKPRGERQLQRDDRAGGRRGRYAERNRPGDRRKFEPRRFDGGPERRQSGRGEHGGSDRPKGRPFQRPAPERSQGGREPRGEFQGRPGFERPQSGSQGFRRQPSRRPERGNRGERFRAENPQREFRPRGESRPREEGGPRRQRPFRGEPRGGVQRPDGERGQRRDGRGRGGRRFGDPGRSHDGRPGEGGFGGNRGGGPKRGRS
jgi:23S rRNA pseudouridine2605 synthase